jgi:hypothetical protein
MIDWVKDPFLYFGVIFFIGHLIQYYTLLEKISEKLKRKRDEEIFGLKKELKKKINPDRIVCLHKELHRIDEHYSDLDSKVYGNFQAGVAIIILSFVGFLRNFASYITQDIVTIILLVLIPVGALFAVNLWRLLSWNLKNR